MPSHDSVGAVLGDGEITLPLMEPGPYRACIVPEEERAQFRATNGAAGGRCVSGILPPHGSLTLDVSRIRVAER